MATTKHALTIDLIRARPSLLLPLLRASGVPIQAPLPLEVVESTFPIAIPDVIADLVLLRRDDDEAPSLAVILEVQLSIDRDKPFRWPLYLAAALDRHRCEVILLVLTYDPTVARWAARDIPFGPRGTFAPVVLGPREIPVLRDDDPQWSAELAILSVLAHAQEPPDDAALRTTRRALSQMSAARAASYLDLLCTEVGDGILRAIEDLMINGEPLSDYFKAQYREAISKGLAQGKAEGLLLVLSARGLQPTEDQRRAIVACTDVARLDGWIRTAVTAQAIDDVLRER